MIVFVADFVVLGSIEEVGGCTLASVVVFLFFVVDELWWILWYEDQWIK